MNQKLKAQIRISVSSIVPIIIIVFLLSIIVVPVDTSNMMLFLLGSLVFNEENTEQLKEMIV